VAAGAAALALVPASVAIAGFHQDARVALTTHHAGDSSGISAQVRSADAAAPGAKPKRATKLEIAFPARTHFNLSTPLAATCTLTDRQLTTPFGPSCPARSQVGSGSAQLNAMPIPPAPIGAKVKAYVSGANSLLVLLFPDQKLLPGTPPIIIHATVAGPRLTLPLPHVVYGKGKGDYKSFAGITAVIVSLKLNVPALGTGSKSLITAGSCHAGRFVVDSRFTYADRTKMLLTSRSTCS
jgi:hypothetical protein